MNRKQRRDALKAKPRWERQSPDALMASLAKNGITAKDLEDQYNAGIKVGQDTTAHNFTAAMCIALHELFGFGPTRYRRLTDRMYEIMVNSFTSAELRDKAIRSLGIKIDTNDPFHMITEE